ncbi:uncharacterized protein VICG_00743 [Vittaforma corneae ATCC 50505]|uniref:Uncharacterized protein n=1 Tax=Vittaforma corneae (strain ATCC 50505) TaxID=993615 RepID=L2GP78_VITCO|nr:uncharacterized protein VICG_00743 [Vittaforma corneae ATCC 50505]ELA42102.1 hypothetical protein VICG_00743 [Vittaforma corneae ATCC 50505]
MLGLLILCLSPVFAQDDDDTTASTKSRTIDPPSFLYREDMNPIERVVLCIIFILIILITVLPKPEYKTYQMAALNGFGLYIGAYEMIFRYFFNLTSPLLMIPCIAAGVGLTLYEPTKPIVGSLACTYPACMIILALLGTQSRIVAIIMMVLFCVVLLFLFSHVESIFDLICKTFIHTFLACCILELTVLGVLKNGLTIDLFSFGLMETISRFIILLLLIGFVFITPVLAFLSKLLLGGDGKSSADAEQNV